MDFWKTMGVLLRRWYVSVPVFVISLGLAVGAFLTVHTQYESTGTLVLTAPTSGGVTAINPADATGPGNPLLDFEGSLTITTQLLIQSLSSPTVQNQVAAQGGVASYQAGDGETGGPFVVIIADATSKAQAEKTVGLALKYAETELNARQKNLNAPPSTFIGTQIVVAPTPATTKIGGKVKAGGVALALGLVLSLAAAFAFESVSFNRRRGKSDDTDDQAFEPQVDMADDVHEESNAERAAKTHKMTPAPPPRQLPRPLRSGSGSGGGQRPAPRPQVGPIGANGRREPFGGSSPVGVSPIGAPGQKQHPAKPPRVHPAPPAPAPVPNKVPNTNGATVNGANPQNGSKNNNGAKSNGGNNGNNGNNNGNNREWPRAEFRAPDSSAG